MPAALLVVATIRGAEKTWYGETAAALAFSGAAVPIAMAAGLSPSTSVMLALPFALLEPAVGSGRPRDGSHRLAAFAQPAQEPKRLFGMITTGAAGKPSPAKVLWSSRSTE